ncbi:hypothetical protein PR202_ga18173 [Eleusine coracana subsp. coracana]|uniref:Uncharacterized protein n=1 Tax=Eleusine coracana subsp. coracana TaxID=191504 RepID=A0AAV5CS64_ELECO|nr:hypothetical protein QOZ80_6AG0508500 [Eleusine coracana subsp. coracana]GJN00946.1 hypothetical protein PR202_ga18173 [Eleusine coracana subsp. coracana]
MACRVRALNVTHVHPTQTGDPSPPNHAEYKLSFFDLFHITTMPMQWLFFFDGPDLPPFPSIIRTLQSSLADTLAIFFPLVGKLAFRASSCDIVIDCSPDAVASGVKFIEAEFCGDADDMRHLAMDHEHDTEVFEQLVPELEAAQLPSPVLAVQVTRSAGDGGAIAVGMSILHAVADGRSVWQFMRTWSTVAREGWQSASGLEPPTFDRTVIPYPRSEEVARKIMHTIAPALPVVRSPSLCTPPDQHRRRSFLLHANQIQWVKQRILAQNEAMGQPLSTYPISTFVAVSALVWTSIVRAKSMDPATDAYYHVTMDLRRRLIPPVDERFFGNCVAPCFARAAVGDLCDNGACLRCAAAAIREAIAAALKGDPLGGVDGWLESLAAIPKERLTRTGSSNRFMAYETDFGWGKPSRVELVLLSVGELVLLLGAREEGVVQVTVALDHEHMDGFATN